MKSFECRTYGKWILAGEHAVLRGAPALVFPIPSRTMSWRYAETDRDLQVKFLGARGDELTLLFWGLMEHALNKLGRSRKDLVGLIEIESSLPVGAGMGASAALCVAVSRWMSWQGWIKESDVYEFARSLEDLFHGESSGVDIAVAMSGLGLKFFRKGTRTPVEMNWTPKWFLSYSGQRGVTSECVAKVKALNERNPSLGKHLDSEMGRAVELAEMALRASEEEGFSMLEEAIEKASSCFLRWGLTEGELDRHMRFLRDKGAVAVKATGSGGGGYVLSLWDVEPPADLDLIKLA